MKQFLLLSWALSLFVSTLGASLGDEVKLPPDNLGVPPPEVPPPDETGLRDLTVALERNETLLPPEVPPPDETGLLPSSRLLASSRCANTDNGCQHWKSYCGNHAYVDQHCPATCGKCGGGGSCADADGGCQHWKSYCGNHAYVDQKCRRTCGTCGGGGGSCADADSGCQHWKSYCGNHAYVDQKCRRTCGTCGGGGGGGSCTRTANARNIFLPNNCIYLPGINNIMRDSDTTTYSGGNFGGRAVRTIWDRRGGEGGRESAQQRRLNVWIYNLQFGSKRVECLCNPEMSQGECGTFCNKYGRAFGQIPHFLRQPVSEFHVNRGRHPWGGGGKSILIHTDDGVNYERGGILAEIFLHECGHVLLQSKKNQCDWVQAQNADGGFPTPYGGQFTEREDLAESVTVWVALKRKHRVAGQSWVSTFERRARNRINWFNKQGWNMHPF